MIIKSTKISQAKNFIFSKRPAEVKADASNALAANISPATGIASPADKTI